MKAKTFIFLFIIGMVLIACDQKDEPQPMNSTSCDFVAIVDANEYSNGSSNPFTIQEVEIDQNCLNIRLSSGGCDGNTWKVKLVDANEIMESFPVQRNLRVIMENKEVCNAYITKDFSFDLSDLQIEEYDIIDLNILEFEDQIRYEY